MNSFRLRLNRVVAQFYAICILFYSNWSDPEDCRGSWVFPKSDSIQLFFLKMQIKRGNRAGRFRLAKWPSLPHPRSNWANLESDYWKWNPTYVNEKIISACISLRMLVYTVIYVHIYISWEYIVERDEFEASFSKNDAGGWLNGSGNLICSPYVDIV